MSFVKQPDGTWGRICDAPGCSRVITDNPWAAIVDERPVGGKPSEQDWHIACAAAVFGAR